MASISKLSMRLFGMPYQFPDSVDPRVEAISTTVGKKFTENIMLEAPVCTFIPGEPVYLPGESTNKKISTASALLEAVSGDVSALTQVLQNNTDDNLRLYDFKNNYNDYIKYVNALCRTGAVFLELDDTVSLGSSSSLKSFDWRNYRWNTNATKSILTRANDYKIANKNKKNFVLDSADGVEGGLDQVLTNYNYVQFYIDPDGSPSDSVNNTTGESMMRSMLDGGSTTMKELAFVANSGGVDTDTLNKFAAESTAAISSGVSEIFGNNNLTGALSRIINLGGQVLQGHNIIIPDIYQNSSYSKSYSITVHLKSPYGTKLGYYMDIFVPMMHLMALAMPRQESANSFSSPFLVKAYVNGLFSCNLGIVESISINKVTESLSVSGLPTEVDVTLSIKDLYSDLSMSPSNDPIRFANNSSLIEYISTNCGMTLTEPNFKKKWENIINTGVLSFTDITSNVKGAVNESIYRTISKMTSLYS